MSTTAMHPLAADYLRRLRRAGRELPAGRLDDLCAEIESHLAEAIPRGRLRRRRAVGDRAPRAARGDRRGRAAGRRRRRRGATRTWRETAAVVLLLLGGFVFGLGWIAGVVLLWSSRLWTLRDKLIGTLIVPGGLAAVLPALLIGSSPSTHQCRGIGDRGFARVSTGTGALRHLRGSRAPCITCSASCCSCS